MGIKFLHSQGLAPLLAWDEGFDVAHLGWYLIFVVVAVIWADAHFYWVHRLLHSSAWLYRRVHAQHHESYNPDVLSGLSFHPVEGALYFSSLLLVFICPTPGWGYHVLRFALILTPFRACVHACTRACVRVCVCAFVCVRACVGACVRVRAGLTAKERLSWLGGGAADVFPVRRCVLVASFHLVFLLLLASCGSQGGIRATP